MGAASSRDLGLNDYLLKSAGFASGYLAYSWRIASGYLVSTYPYLENMRRMRENHAFRGAGRYCKVKPASLDFQAGFAGGLRSGAVS